MKHGALPYNHTMADLVFAMDDVFPDHIKDIREELINLDSYQEICDVDSYAITPPMATEIPSMLNLGEKLRELLQQKLN